MNANTSTECLATCVGTCQGVDFNTATRGCFQHAAATECNALATKAACTHYRLVNCRKFQSKKRVSLRGSFSFRCTWSKNVHLYTCAFQCHQPITEADLHLDHVPEHVLFSRLSTAKTPCFLSLRRPEIPSGERSLSSGQMEREILGTVPKSHELMETHGGLGVSI